MMAFYEFNDDDVDDIDDVNDELNDMLLITTMCYDDPILMILGHGEFGDFYDVC